MPTINGVTYPELNIHSAPNSILRVALLNIDENYLYSLMDKLEILKHYLSDIGSDFEIEIRAVKTEALESSQDRYSYILFDDPGENVKEILSYAHSNNIDLIYSDSSKLIADFYKSGSPFQYAETTAQLENEIEAFVTGKNVPWDFETPVWNATWLSKYIENQPLMGNLRELHNIASSTLGYSDAQASFVRALQHKAMQVRHCEEIILSLIQRKHFAERNYTIRNSYNYDDFYDYSFEIDYHLGNLYFLLSGTFDIIGRLLTSLYSISGKDVRPNIEHANFLEQLKDKNIELYNLYSQKEMNDWMIWIKRKRNFVAHESEVSYTDVIKAKKTKLTDAEVEAKVDAMQKWDAFRLLLGDEYVESQKAMGRFVVRTHEDNEIVTKNAMQVKYWDNEEGEIAMALFHPLVDTKADYDKYQILLDSTAKILLNVKQ